MSDRYYALVVLLIAILLTTLSCGRNISAGDESADPPEDNSTSDPTAIATLQLKAGSGVSAESVSFNTSRSTACERTTSNGGQNQLNVLIGTTTSLSTGDYLNIILSPYNGSGTYRLRGSFWQDYSDEVGGLLYIVNSSKSLRWSTEQLDSNPANDSDCSLLLTASNGRLSGTIDCRKLYKLTWGVFPPDTISTWGGNPVAQDATGNFSCNIN